MSEETETASFGSRLKAAREACNLTQTELAELMTTKDSVVSRWEHDKVVPRPDTVVRLGGFLGVKPAWLLFGTGRRNAPARGLVNRVPQRRKRRRERR